MKSIFLSHKQLFENPLPLFRTAGAEARASDLVLVTIPDDGFTLNGDRVNYFLSGEDCADRFGRDHRSSICAVRPALLLEPGDEKLLSRVRESGGVITAELGTFPMFILDSSMREMAEKQFRDGTLKKTGKSYTVAGEKRDVYRLGAKQIVRIAVTEETPNGYVQLSDGSAVTSGEEIFLEVRPVRWYYDEINKLLISGRALFAGLSREDAGAYLDNGFIEELLAEDDGETASGEAGTSYHIEEHDELDLIRAFIEADIPVFIHGLTGDGKSDRVKEIDPDVLDIELVNETPETINGRAVYNESTDTIIDIKPVWLVKLERLCEDGKTHILFFDELTNATKQTQAVIFKIVLERFVNNRWPLPENARIVAAGNDRAESSVAHDLAEPLFGRFAHIYIRTTVENWMPWAVRKKINPYVMEFLANNDLYLRTSFTGTEGYADPRRWEMVSRVLDSSGNDFSLIEPIVGHEAAEAFIRFFRAQEEMADIVKYTDEELARMTVARKYQIAQQCLYAVATKPAEAEELVKRLGPEFEAWFRYVIERKRKH
ncbi:MAG: ATP-binding protein [Clostridiales bacterium]|nr:ATP-binding protein [Clostridiales bacterium]